MSDTIISFEIAKLAKEKGFNYETIHVWCEYNTVRQRKAKKPFLRRIQQSSQREKHLHAPTQALLQKWLREVHKIDVLVYKVGDSYTCLQCRGHHSTYENALEEGLFNELNRLP